MKMHLSLMLLFCLGTVMTQAADDKEVAGKKLPKLDLYLCIGQSNMAGRGPMNKELGDEKPIPNAYLFTPDNNWEPASNPLNRYSTIRKDMKMQQISPAYGFAKEVAAVSKRPIGLVVNAKGGTSITQWLKGAEDGFYEEALKRALEAKKWGDFKAILWHQGEANSSTGGAKAYPEQLRRMVEDFRRDLGDEKLLFVAGELAHWRKYSDGRDANAAFNEMIDKIATFLPHSAVVSAEGLKPLNGDLKDPHFDRESQLIFGKRYGEVVIKAGVVSK